MPNIDEGPSEEDIARFERDTALCPDCGAEIWDQAEVCPKCFAYVGGNTSHRLPIQRWFAQRWVIVVIMLILMAMVLIWWRSLPVGIMHEGSGIN